MNQFPSKLAPPFAVPPTTDVVPLQHYSSRREPGGDDGTFGSDVVEAVSPELVARFHELIDEVARQLEQSPGVDRELCRADAIALLLAASDLHAARAEDVEESPLAYLLLEEQQKMAAILGNATPAPATNLIKVS